jgi:hypothetical protein
MQTATQRTNEICTLLIIKTETIVYTGVQHK